MKEYLLLNNYHNIATKKLKAESLTEVKKEIVKSLRDYSYEFENEIEDDWKKYYPTFEKAAEANANSIFETFMGEVEIIEITPYVKNLINTYLENSINKDSTQSIMDNEEFYRIIILDKNISIYTFGD